MIDMNLKKGRYEPASSLFTFKKKSEGKVQRELEYTGSVPASEKVI